MGVIVGIGGGRMTDLETLTIDKEIVSFTGLESPNALYIPTASYDSPEKWDEFRGFRQGLLKEMDTHQLSIIYDGLTDSQKTELQQYH